jgi:hypothetical protein
MSDTKWADKLETMPTRATGQAHDLKYDDGRIRVWLARTGIEDGEPFERTVYVEKLDEGSWVDVGYFDGDEEYPHPWGDLGVAYRATMDEGYKLAKEG